MQRLKEVCRIWRTSLTTEKNIPILKQHTYLATNRVLLLYAMQLGRSILWLCSSLFYRLWCCVSFLHNFQHFFPSSLIQLRTLKFLCIWLIVYLYSFRYESQAIIQYKGLWWKSAILSDLTIIETTKEPGFTVFSNSQIKEVLKKCTKTNTTLQ